jgi:hypothetical protein
MLGEPESAVASKEVFRNERERDATQDWRASEGYERCL